MQTPRPFETHDRPGERRRRRDVRRPACQRARRDPVEPTRCSASSGLTTVPRPASAALNLHQQRLLEIARQLASRPRLVLLDEVMAGLNDTEIAGSIAMVRRIRAELGVTVIWVEHVMKAVINLAERVLVLNFGRLIADGSPHDVMRKPDVVEAYLGDRGLRDRMSVGRRSVIEPLLGRRVCRPAMPVRWWCTRSPSPSSPARRGDHRFQRRREDHVVPRHRRPCSGRDQGAVSFDGADITRLPTHRIARLGLAYVPAERHLFPAHVGRREPQPRRVPRADRDRDAEAVVFDVFPRLGERRRQPAGTLSGGEQQMLAVGRALMSTPRLLMLDEPTTVSRRGLAGEAYRALERSARPGSDARRRRAAGAAGAGASPAAAMSSRTAAFELSGHIGRAGGQPRRAARLPGHRVTGPSVDVHRRGDRREGGDPRRHRARPAVRPAGRRADVDLRPGRDPQPGPGTSRRARCHRHLGVDGQRMGCRSVAAAASASPRRRRSWSFIDLTLMRRRVPPGGRGASPDGPARSCSAWPSSIDGYLVWQYPIEQLALRIGGRRRAGPGRRHDPRHPAGVRRSRSPRASCSSCSSVRRRWAAACDR